MQPVLNQSLHTFRRFGERHGYDVVVGGEEAIADRAPAWSKIVLLRRLLESYDYVLWIDADAIILDDSVDPADLFGVEHYQALVGIAGTRKRVRVPVCGSSGISRRRPTFSTQYGKVARGTCNFIPGSRRQP